tara:strand:+ start:1567 stop:2499 length:933 start_codon:yes stop_codon:yes gene_type:complete
MFSVIFPGQGSQSVGMAKEFYDRFGIFKKIFYEADDILNFPISKLILEGPKDKLNLTQNTQPAIFLVSFAIFKLIKEEFNIDLNNANYFAGHSLGEYSALACSDALKFEDTLKLLKIRGQSMQDAVPNNTGGMMAILGSSIEKIETILKNNINNYRCYIANDNSSNQIVVSGYNEDLNKLGADLKQLKIKNIKLQVSAPFHCELMSKATLIMEKEINNLKISKPKNLIISNVSSDTTDDIDSLRNLLIKQIESRVRWRESINFILSNKINNFIEIGPGKVLINLIKRIDKNIKVCSVNNIEDIKQIELND